MFEQRKKLRKKIAAIALLDAGLVLIPYLLLTFGGMEFMSYQHVRQSLTAAGMEAMDFFAVDHNEAGVGVGGVDPSLLDALRAPAIAIAQKYLLDMGFSQNFVTDVQISVDFVNRLDPDNLDFPSGGFSQNTGRKLVGAMSSVPTSRAMMFGNLSAKVFNLAINYPEKLTVMAFRWKQWKKSSGTT